jgi:GxxExxY protein
MSNGLLRAFVPWWQIFSDRKILPGQKCATKAPSHKAISGDDFAGRPVKNFQPLTEREEEIGNWIVDSAFNVHKALGPGLLERIYETCLCHELTKRGLEVQRQVPVPIRYDGMEFDEGLRLEMLVAGLVICELKAVDKPHPVWEAQLLSYLRLTNRRLGYLINFNVPLIRDGIQRIIL